MAGFEDHSYPAANVQSIESQRSTVVFVHPTDVIRIQNTYYMVLVAHQAEIPHIHLCMHT